MTAPERRGPERPGPDYPPEWDREPAEPYTTRVVHDVPTTGIPCSVPMHRDYCMRVRGHDGTHLPWPPAWPVSELEASMSRHPAGKALS